MQCIRWYSEGDYHQTTHFVYQMYLKAHTAFVPINILIKSMVRPSSKTNFKGEKLSMNKIIKLGMLFNEGNVPDFGSIEQDSSSRILFLLSEDIPKLNSMLTKTAAQSYLENGSSFPFHTGDRACIIDWLTEGTGSMYVYHGNTDHWYEIIPNE